MKIRDKLNSQLRWGFLALLLSWIFIVTTMALFGEKIPEYVPVIAFAPFLGTIIYLTFGICCPKCKSRIGHVIGYSIDIFTFGLSKKIKFCPYCGVSFDSEIE